MLLRAVFFCRDSCIDSRYFPIKIQDGQVWTFLEKVNIVNVFFWKFIIFSEILKFEFLPQSIEFQRIMVNSYNPRVYFQEWIKSQKINHKLIKSCKLKRKQKNDLFAGLRKSRLAFFYLIYFISNELKH